MRRTYTVTVRGEVPPDLGERIARAHVAAILAAETARSPGHETTAAVAAATAEKGNPSANQSRPVPEVYGKPRRA